MKEQLQQELIALSHEGKIACKKAFEAAEKFNVSTKEVGDLCNELKLKIVGCQLGCFK